MTHILASTHTNELEQGQKSKFKSKIPKYSCLAATLTNSSWHTIQSVLSNFFDEQVGVEQLVVDNSGLSSSAGTRDLDRKGIDVLNFKWIGEGWLF